MIEIMHTPQHPALVFASKEWESLAAQYGHLWKDYPRFKAVHIGTWSQIIEHGISPKLEQALQEGASERLPSSYWLETSVKEERIIVSGKTEQSTLYAVYDAFRQFAGVNWIYPGEAPALSEPAAAACEGKLFEPWFDRRGFVIENLHDPEYILQMIDWNAKNRVNEIFFTFMLWDKIKEDMAPEIEKRGMQLTLGGHSMKFFLNRQEADAQHLAANPYHAKNQLDYADLTWQEPFFQQVANYCADAPQLARLSLWPEDLPAGDNKEFLALYISFIERLQRHMQRTLPHIVFEHIAYNAGLAWNMLELGETSASSQIDTLLAYWGRDYRHPFHASPSGDDRRAEAAIKGWSEAAQAQERKLSIFEYYSDHFMYSALFPSIPTRIIEDAAYYREIGAAGMTNLIVPCPGYPDYNWKWAAGFNSYVFSRAVWGDSKEQILQDYYSYYGEEDRSIAKLWKETVEHEAAGVTAWNFPLFPGRVVDVRKFRDNEEHRGEVIALLQNMIAKLTEAYGLATISLEQSSIGANMRHLIAQAEACLQAWLKPPHA